jgi:hypothetical protein
MSHHAGESDRMSRGIWLWTCVGRPGGFELPPGSYIDPLNRHFDELCLLAWVGLLASAYPQALAAEKWHQACSPITERATFVV